MPTLHMILGALAVAVTSASVCLLATNADHNLIRSCAMVGMMYAVGSALYVLIDRRMSRVETATARVIKVEQDVLLAVRDRARLN